MAKCEICGNKFKPVFSSTEKTCRNDECVKAYLKKFFSKKDIKRRIGLMKENVSLPKLKSKAKRVFQAWVRKRDKDLPCISCGNVSSKYDGGHYYKAELYSGLIFNEMNVNKQCARPCNKDLDGNLINYRKGLVLKYGLKAVEELEAIADSKRGYKYTRQELIDIIEKYK